jgi:hypothetical protein
LFGSPALDDRAVGDAEDLDPAENHVASWAVCPSLRRGRYVLIAEGLSEHAPNPPALDNFHEKVHRGKPGDHLLIIRIEMDADCPAQLPGSVVPAD